MYKYCPSCHSTNIKKNGHTHYGKQNHQCKCCGRQSVPNNKHTKTGWLKATVKKASKGRLALRAICRTFDVGLTWLQAFARTLWKKTPVGPGLPTDLIRQVEKLQVFGVQADGLWPSVQKRTQKRWIWVAYDPVHRLVAAYHIGGRGKKAAKKFWDKTPPLLRGCCSETDDRHAYQGIIPIGQHKVGKDLTFHIEGPSATIRAGVGRLVRKPLSFSKLGEWHNLAIGWFFWQFNLERQHYI